MDEAAADGSALKRGSIESRESWKAAWTTLAILSISFGSPLLIVVGMPRAGEQQIGQRLHQVLCDRCRHHDRREFALEWDGHLSPLSASHRAPPEKGG